LCGNSLPDIIEEGKKYADLGVDALVALAPNYYPVEDKHALNWFEQLAENLPLPVFLYNIPATTHHSISLDVIEKMSHHPNVIGIKDSQPDQSRLDESLERWSSREDFLFLVGCAANSCYGLKKGADGIVPSVGNLFPELYADLFDAAKGNDFEECARLQKLANKVSEYNQEGRTITGAIPALKALMSIKGLCGLQVMPPMQRMTPEVEKVYLAAMEDKILNLSFKTA
jgi:4-hydroxy-tetrahydrodipicolinate synthase